MLKKIQEEINDFKTNNVELCEGYSFSTYKLLRRIMLYKSQCYPSGKLDSQGRVKYWFDVISPRAQSEIKNIDFDTKDITLYSDSEADAIKVLLANSALKEWLHESGQAQKLNSGIEQGTEWGNVVWKKLKDNYKVLELNNVMVLNQTAFSLDDSDVIEQEIMFSTDLRKKTDVWENVEELIKSAKTEKKTSPEFYIYERNGEVSEKEYNQAKKKKGGREDKYLLAKVIVGGLEKDKPTQILFCEEMEEKPYKEYHRSSYSGRWLRVGMFELLMDVQTRANEIGNQIARGLEWSSKTIFRSSDKVIAQNILTDLQNGDIIKSVDLSQVQTRMEGLDQLIADWNRLMEMADKLANSYEVVTGETMPAGTPFRLAATLNINAGKLFDFIREKLGIVLQDVIEEWILPDLLKDLKGRDVLRLTGDSGKLKTYYQALVDGWYIKNLLALPPHTEEIALVLKEKKLQELSQKEEVMVQLEKEMWKEFKPRVRVAIVDEGFNVIAEMEDLKAFIALEQDPLRRTALIEKAMKLRNIDISSLPKTPPMPTTAPVEANQQRGSQPQKGQKPPSILDNILAGQR